MDNEQSFDAIVIGSGFGGIYMLHKLRNELGLKTRAFEKGGGVGGTWYFNRYPGAKSDTEGFVYRYLLTKTYCRNGTGTPATWNRRTSRAILTMSSTGMTCAATSRSTPR